MEKEQIERVMESLGDLNTDPTPGEMKALGPDFGQRVSEYMAKFEPEN